MQSMAYQSIKLATTKVSVNRVSVCVMWLVEFGQDGPYWRLVSVSLYIYLLVGLHPRSLVSNAFSLESSYPFLSSLVQLTSLMSIV